MLSKTQGSFLCRKNICNSMIIIVLVPCHCRGRGFEPRRPRHKQVESKVYGSDIFFHVVSSVLKGAELSLRSADPEDHVLATLFFADSLQ